MSDDDDREDAPEGDDAAEAPEGDDKAAGKPAKAAKKESGKESGKEPEKASRRKRRKKAEGGTAAAPPPAVASKSTRDDAPEPPEETAGAGDGSDGKDRMDLPKWNRARVKRKQVAGEEEDAFQASVRKAGTKAIQRAPVVLGLIVLIAGGIALFVWYQGKLAEDDAAATRILASAAGVQARGEVTDVEAFKEQRKLPPPVPLLNEEAERAQQADKALADLASAAGESDANKVGDLMRAAQHVKDGKFTDATAAYTAFLDANPAHEFAFLAREGKALALEANGDTDGALAEFDALAGKTGDFYRDQALWHKGRILEAAQRGDEALEVYKLYVEEYPLDKDSIAKPQVVERLRELQPDLVPADAAPPGGAGGLGGLQLPPGLGQ